MKEDYKKLIEDSKSYLQTRYDLARLELLDKTSKILGIFILIIVALLVLFTAIAYFSVALVHLMSQCMPVSAACCILGGVMLIVLLVLYLLRRPLFINPFVKLLSSSLFSPKDYDETLNTDDDETTV